jgi:hypothetical protein
MMLQVAVNIIKYLAIAMIGFLLSLVTFGDLLPLVGARNYIQAMFARCWRRSKPPLDLLREKNGWVDIGDVTYVTSPVNYNITSAEIPNTGFGGSFSSVNDKIILELGGFDKEIVATLRTTIADLYNGQTFYEFVKEHKQEYIVEEPEIVIEAGDTVQITTLQNLAAWENSMGFYIPHPDYTSDYTIDDDEADMEEIMDDIKEVVVYPCTKVINHWQCTIGKFDFPTYLGFYMGLDANSRTYDKGQLIKTSAEKIYSDPTRNHIATNGDGNIRHLLIREVDITPTTVTRYLLGFQDGSDELQGGRKTCNNVMFLITVTKKSS